MPCSATRFSLPSRNSRTSMSGRLARRCATPASSSVGAATMAPARRTPSLRKTAMRASAAGNAAPKAPSRVLAGKAARIQPPACPARRSMRMASATSGSFAPEGRNGRLTEIASAASSSSAGENDARSGAACRVRRGDHAAVAVDQPQRVDQRHQVGARVQRRRGLRRRSPAGDLRAVRPASRAGPLPRRAVRGRSRRSTRATASQVRAPGRRTASRRRCHSARHATAASDNHSASAISHGLRDCWSAAARQDPCVGLADRQHYLIVGRSEHVDDVCVRPAAALRRAPCMRYDLRQCHAHDVDAACAPQRSRERQLSLPTHSRDRRRSRRSASWWSSTWATTTCASARQGPGARCSSCSTARRSTWCCST